MWCASYRQVLCRTSNGIFQFKQSSSPREPEILAFDLAPRVSIFPEDDPLNHMGFQISADAFKAPIQYNNVLTVGLEYIGIEVVWFCSEMWADGLICSIRYDSHSATEILSILYSAALYYFYSICCIYFTLYFRGKVV